MKKGLFALLLSMGMILPAKSPEVSKLTDKNYFQIYSDFSNNYFLKTKNASYNFESEDYLRENGINYSLEKISESNPTKVPEEKKFLPMKEFWKIVDSLYQNGEVPKYVDKESFKNFIDQESDFNVNAYNKFSKASGLGQMLHGAWYQVDKSSNYYMDRFNPEKNLENSLKYIIWIEKALGKMHPSWKDVKKEEKMDYIVASYNWGIGNLNKVGWDLAYIPEETKNYKEFIQSKIKDNI